MTLNLVSFVLYIIIKSERFEKYSPIAIGQKYEIYILM